MFAHAVLSHAVPEGTIGFLVGEIYCPIIDACQWHIASSVKTHGRIFFDPFRRKHTKLAVEVMIVAIVSIELADLQNVFADIQRSPDDRV